MGKIYVDKTNEELKKLFKNVYFIIGTAYAGKSTMIKKLHESYPDSIMLRENYIEDVMKDYGIDPENQPNLCYFDTMTSWDEFVNRSPEEYVNWMKGCSKEATPIEINEILKYVHDNPDKKIFVDTNMSIDVLKEISDKEHVLVMLTDREESVKRFFEREDKEKQFLYQVLLKSKNPNALDNYRKILQRINSKEEYDNFYNSGFNVLLKDNNREIEDTLKIVKNYFKLEELKEENIPDLNIFMVCDKVNKKAFSNLPNRYHFRNIKKEELDLWKEFPFDSDEDKKEYKGFMDDYFNNVYQPLEEEFYKKCLFICNDDDKPVATCFLWKSYNEIYTIHWLKVLKEYEGLGLGRAILTKVMSEITPSMYPIYLHTQASSFRAIKLYTDFGFEIITDEKIGNRKNNYKESLVYLEYYMKDNYKKLKFTKSDGKLDLVASKSNIDEF